MGHSSLAPRSQSIKRRYLCRTFVLESESTGGSKPYIAITVERQRSVLIDLCDDFNLPSVDFEAVQHLADGLTSKENAHRMNISPNSPAIALLMSPHFTAPEFLPLPNITAPQIPVQFCAVDEARFRLIMDFCTAGWSSGSSLGS